MCYCFFFFFFQAEDGIRDLYVTGVQTCALPILLAAKEVWMRTDPASPFTGALAVMRHFPDRIESLVNRTRKTLTADRSEEHTSELQSRRDLVCRLLLEKKKQNRGIR